MVLGVRPPMSAPRLSPDAVSPGPAPSLRARPPRSLPRPRPALRERPAACDSLPPRPPPPNPAPPKKALAPQQVPSQRLGESASACLGAAEDAIAALGEERDGVRVQQLGEEVARGRLHAGLGGVVALARRHAAVAAHDGPRGALARRARRGLRAVAVDDGDGKPAVGAPFGRRAQLGGHPAWGWGWGKGWRWGWHSGWH